MNNFTVTLRKQIFCLDAEREMIYLERKLDNLNFPPFPELGIKLRGDSVLCEIISVVVGECTSGTVCYCKFEEHRIEQNLKDRLTEMKKAGWKEVQECWGNPE